MHRFKLQKNKAKVSASSKSPLGDFRTLDLAKNAKRGDFEVKENRGNLGRLPRSFKINMLRISSTVFPAQSDSRVAVALTLALLPEASEKLDEVIVNGYITLGLSENTWAFKLNLR